MTALCICFHRRNEQALRVRVATLKDKTKTSLVNESERILLSKVGSLCDCKEKKSQNFETRSFNGIF